MNVTKYDLDCPSEPTCSAAFWTIPRRGAVIVWVLPVLAVLAAATYWLATGKTSQWSDRSTVTEKVVVSIPAPAPSTSAEKIDSRKLARRVTEAVSIPISAVSPQITPKPQPTTTDQISPTPASKKSAADIEKTLIGEWSGYYQGQRQLKVSADGSGTIVAHPEGLAATLLAAELTFKIRWTVKGDQLEFETVGGEPLDKVNIVVKMYGQRRSHKILDLQPDTMVLLDEDGVTKYSWNRVTSEPQATAAPKKEE